MNRGTIYALLGHLRVAQLRLASVALIIMMLATLADVSSALPVQ